MTAASLSSEVQPSGPALASGRNCPFARASARHFASVAGLIPSSFASRAKGTLFGGGIFVRTAAFLPVEYATSPSHLAPQSIQFQIEAPRQLS